MARMVHMMVVASAKKIHVVVGPQFISLSKWLSDTYLIPT